MSLGWRLLPLLSLVPFVVLPLLDVRQRSLRRVIGVTYHGDDALSPWPRRSERRENSTRVRKSGSADG
jgi:hypothetical protein